MHVVVSWSDLGNPTRPGIHRVPGLGAVDVQQKHIDVAGEHGGHVDLELIEVKTHDSDGVDFIIGLFQKPK
jgi:hypothetical protein